MIGSFVTGALIILSIFVVIFPDSEIEIQWQKKSSRRKASKMMSTIFLNGSYQSEWKQQLKLNINKEQ